MSPFAKYKKLFFVIIFLALVLLLGWLLWQVFFKPTPPSSIIQPDTPSSITGLPTIDKGDGITDQIGGPGYLPGGLDSELPDETLPDINRPSPLAVGGITEVEALNQSPVIGSTLSKDGRVQYYDQDDGKFYRVDPDGNITSLSDKVFYNVEDVVWAPDKNQAIIEYPDGNKISYNFLTKKQVTLPSHWQDFSFAPSSKQIISESIGLDPENRWLVVSKPDGSEANTLAYIGTRDKYVYPSWSPNNQIVAMYTKGVDFNRQEVFFVGLNDENFKSTIVEGRGFQSQWSTAGDRLLYSVYHSRDDYRPRLWIVDAKGDTISQNRRSFDLSTWANKCTFASNTDIYCAVPQNLEKGSGLYPELADRTQDDLYKIDLTTETKKLIAVPQDAYNISQIMVPGGQNYLYFTDKKTGLIYKIKLK